MAITVLKLEGAKEKVELLEFSQSCNVGEEPSDRSLTLRRRTGPQQQRLRSKIS